MSRILPVLAIGVGLVLVGCTSSPQQAAVQLPGESTHSGLQVPPDLDERPTQTAAAAQSR